MNSLQEFFVALSSFAGKTLIPLLFAVALLFFIFNAFRYFIIGGGDEKEREKAKQLALYGIAAFVILVSLWGIVNLLVGGLGFSRGNTVCPDYLPTCNNYGWGNSPQGEFGGTQSVNRSTNNGWGNNPQGEFGGTQSVNRSTNNGWGNSSQGEFGGATVGNETRSPFPTSGSYDEVPSLNNNSQDTFQPDSSLNTQEWETPSDKNTNPIGTEDGGVALPLPNQRTTGSVISPDEATSNAIFPGPAIDI